MWSDWLVVCDCSFSLSALWSCLSVPTVLLGFLLPWMWDLPSWPLQQSAASAPYLRHRVAPLGHRPCPRALGSFSWPCSCAIIAHSVQFSRSVVSDSLWPHESQHARPPCPSPTPRVYPNSCPSSPWFHPAISSSVFPFSSCPQSLPASGSFPMSQLLHEVAKVLEFQLQHQSFQWTPRTDLL